jgi:RNA polymerase sigma factor (sigma-70 family)
VVTIIASFAPSFWRLPTVPRSVKARSAENLYHQYRHSAICIAYSIVRDVWPEPSDEAEDIANEALEKASACQRQYDDTRPFWPWLRRIVQTTAIDRLRKFGSPLLGSADGQVLNPAQTPDWQVGNEEERRLARSLVAEAVDKLAPREKDLFLRFYVQDEPFTTLAQAFAIAPQTARGLVSRAKHSVLTRLGMVTITNREMKLLLSI